MLSYRLNEVKKIEREVEKDFARLMEQARTMGEAMRQGVGAGGESNDD